MTDPIFQSCSIEYYRIEVIIVIRPTLSLFEINYIVQQLKVQVTKTVEKLEQQTPRSINRLHKGHVT